MHGVNVLYGALTDSKVRWKVHNRNENGGVEEGVCQVLGTEKKAGNLWASALPSEESLLWCSNTEKNGTLQI